MSQHPDVQKMIEVVEASTALTRVEALLASQCRALDAAALFPDKATPAEPMDLAPAVKDLYVADLERIDAALGGDATENLARLRDALTDMEPDEETEEEDRYYNAIAYHRAEVMSRLAADPHRGLRILESAIQARTAQDAVDDADPNSVRSILRRSRASQPDA